MPKEGANGLLGRNQILGASDLKTAHVDVPEWGGRVRVRAMNAGERSELGAVWSKDGMPNEFFPKIVARCVIDENGKRVFRDQDIPVIGERSWDPIERIVTQVLEMSALTAEAAKELGKDSEPRAKDSSSSA